MYEPTEAGAFFPGVLNAYDDGAVLAFLDSVLFRLRWIAMHHPGLCSGCPCFGTKRADFVVEWGATICLHEICHV